ncbi:hypothetical protein A0128_15900 [Leptospira tipperaryensis]|uniref:EamA domain-containing protein n=1 Tax=Leptospira tipperaryensis TaxID=2564040 RepID=A0A1D7V036_9LEPT|nr:hypothetical protein [Leptospira tipperaryensis]AOP35192.1 hypothetical protein A0128_15900 [Leptospira tipperaryensis]
MGLFWGFIEVFIFSLTLPTTKLTIEHFDPLFVGLGRAVLAGILAVFALKITKTQLLPLATAVAGTILAKESQTILFWISSLFGSSIVIFYFLWNQEVSLRFGDLFLFLAVLSAAVGYAEGGKLALGRALHFLGRIRFKSKRILPEPQVKS